MIPIPFLLNLSAGDYFFFLLLGTIAVTRTLLVSHKMAGPTIAGLRIRHYMPGLLLLILGFVFHNLTLYAIAFGLIIDELPVILAKGPGHKDEYWRGCEEYHTRWSFAGVLILTVLIFLFRDFATRLIF